MFQASSNVFSLKESIKLFVYSFNIDIVSSRVSRHNKPKMRRLWGGRKCAQTMGECPKREVKNRTDHRIATLKALRKSPERRTPTVQPCI